MSNKNNSPEQKAAWKANQKIGSRFVESTPSYAYRPQPKSPSIRDRHRMQVATERRAFDV